ncbi:protocadherin Fat 4 isoform X2 [Gouania willdenowi]|uniref:protocadherin Fat 4 isoform X2 n=1 Tax=Gouania willdenowi TaxID=441366 RepID=UPI001054BD57|nr:protocadherin Fat 4-like isoform X2 [Gouania willdenowi]
MMDLSGPWRIYFHIFSQFMVFGSASSHDSSSTRVNVSSEVRTTGKLSWLPSVPTELWFGDLQPDERWRTHKASLNTVYSFQVKEDTSPGTVVGKVEAMSETLTPFTYSVQEDDGESLFLLSPISGEFLLSRSLDFETQRFYVLTVQVQQRDSVSSVRVYFNVLDVNDNPPVFSQDVFSASLLEDTHVGMCFLSINVSDKDDGENGDLKVKIASGDEEETFFFHSSGSLCLNQGLDWEKRSFYNLTITANDCVQPVSSQFTSAVHVIVYIEDINDNAPVFVSAKSASIPEDTPLYSVIMTVEAMDEDSGPSGTVLYYLNNTSEGMFSIDSRSGEIFLMGTLDREEVDTLFLTVTAADEGSPQMATTIQVTVIIEDVNDHNPEMSQSSYSLQVQEDVARGTSLFQAQALDRDSGPNGRIRYKLTQTSPFVVDSVRGVVTVMDRLDRERESNYTFFMIAVDQGNIPRSATSTIIVTVLDVNDVVPRFSPETLTLHVKENEDNFPHILHQASASDEDSGINSQLVYHMQNGNNDDLFSISPNGSFEVSHSLDREKNSLYIITVTAVDSGLPSLTGTLTLHIVVDDVNDNHPEFPEEAYNTIVSEDSAIGTVFAMITASDPDEGVSGEIRYFIENPDVPFAIEETSGELYTTGVLNRESEAIYRMTVIGSDSHPAEPLFSSVLVIVLIGDINDHWPQFLNSPYVAYVPIDLKAGSVVCAVQATDEDTDMNAELYYSLYGPSSDLFSIDPHSGAIFSSSDIHDNDDSTLHVHVEDAGETPKFDITTVSVRFQNSSDFPRLNVEIVHFSLSEDEPVGTLVAVISAASSRAEPISFYLASGNFEDVFLVEQTSGAVLLEKPLDYENRKDFPLLVEARDAGSPPFSSFAEVYLNISDVNDNAPQFTQGEYQCNVFENSPPSIFCDVLAVDADSDIYGMVVYRITEGNSEDIFSVDPENGLLSTTSSLDREHIAEFNLTIEAAELENPQNKDTTTVVVTVLDKNDNPPHFTQVFYIEVTEDIPPGHTVSQITTSDDDTGANTLTYSIVDENEDLPFYIDLTTGFITVVLPLDREEHDHYVFKVVVNDSAWSVSTDVTVTILDVNDNKPEFSHAFYNVVFPETRDEEVLVLQVIATDADVGKNAEILYLVEPSNVEFWVNSSTGEIYTKQPLRLFNIYQFRVIAFDHGSVPLFSTATVTVRSEPHNLYPPMFLPVKTLLAVPHHLAVGTELVQLTAFDPDLNSSTDIKFVLKGGNSSNFVWVQPHSGKLILNRTLAGSANRFLHLLVEAEDQGFPSLTSQIGVMLEITGRNQFAPSFSRSRVSFSVPEDLPVGSVIGKIQAEDRDYGANGAITYQVTFKNQSLPFSVGKASGLLTLIKELDFEIKDGFDFQVKAMDGGWFSKTSLLNVTVRVQDVNDNPPVFSSSEYIASVLENAEIGSVVADVKAFDNDSGVNAQIFYSLFVGPVDKFKVDSRNGTITTLELFDFEDEQMFDLAIKASNPGGYTLFSLAHVVIHIIDVNEFTPTFRNKDIHFSVFRNVTIGTLVGKVKATDYDLGREGLVFYLMFGPNKKKGFEIDQLSGEIYTTSSLRKLGNSRVILKVLAKNAGVITEMNTDEALVHINVINTNDAPIFSSTRYLANISEDSSIGTSVVKVSALDQDSFSDWSRFFFSIASGNTELSFTIDASSGVVSVNSRLDRELCSIYHLTITATDNGSPPATGTTDVIVTIVDVNDNAPMLISTLAEVKENQPQGTIAARLNASDPDSPPNQGPFTYWLINSSGTFSLTSDGVLITTSVLDREQMSAYIVLVGVSDSGFPLPQSSTTTFHINVMDENDNPPSPRNIFIEVKYFGISFQGGWIGHVHPDDQDESDTFVCSIKSGPVNMFSLHNGTCGLWSSPFQGEATLNITVEASDQLHLPVNNSIYVSYKGFTNASVDSCIFFYVASTSMEEFLSKKYLRFVKALDSLFNLQASKTHVFGIKDSGNEILLLAAVRNYNGEYINREIASGISAGHQKLLEKQSNVSISHITSDPCLTSPCQNRARCNQNIYVSQEVLVLESAAVIFVSPQKEVFNCTCQTGFMGSRCEQDMDECQASPCKNEATCVNTEGSFFCRCQDGFTDTICSADEDECLKVECQNGGSCVATQEGYRCYCAPGFEGRRCEKVKDHCRLSPCAEGSCVSSLTGFSCNCPFGVSGIHCEEQSYGFEELSFLEFPPLDHRTNIIFLEFATVQKNSLLVYNPGGPSSRDFFILEILDGTVQLSYDLGAGSVRLKTHKNVADGRFHSVTVRRIGNIGYLNVDNCTEIDNKGFCSSRRDGHLMWTAVT